MFIHLSFPECVQCNLQCSDLFAVTGQAVNVSKHIVWNYWRCAHSICELSQLDHQIFPIPLPRKQDLSRNRCIYSTHRGMSLQYISQYFSTTHPIKTRALSLTCKGYPQSPSSNNAWSKPRQYWQIFIVVVKKPLRLYMIKSSSKVGDATSAQNQLPYVHSSINAFHWHHCIIQLAQLQYRPIE